MVQQQLLRREFLLLLVVHQGKSSSVSVSPQFCVLVDVVNKVIAIVIVSFLCLTAWLRLLLLLLITCSVRDQRHRWLGCALLFLSLSLSPA